MKRVDSKTERSWSKTVPTQSRTTGKGDVTLRTERWHAKQKLPIPSKKDYQSKNYTGLTLQNTYR